MGWPGQTGQVSAAAFVAKGERKIERGSACPCEFGPALRTKSGHVVVEPFQEFERIGMHMALGVTAGGKCPKPS